MVGLFTRTTALLNLAAAIAALVGSFVGPAWLAMLGWVGLVAVNAWTVLYARRRPELVADAERHDRARQAGSRPG